MTNTRLHQAISMWCSFSLLTNRQALKRSASGQHVQIAADQVAAGMARKAVQGQQHRVHQQDDRAQAEHEVPVEDEPLDSVDPQEHDDDQRRPEGVAVDVLDDPRKPRLAFIALAPYQAPRRPAEPRRRSGNRPCGSSSRSPGRRAGR